VNLNRGLLRLWIALSIGWVAVCSYEIYAYNASWETGFAAAKATTGARESERALLIQNYVFDAKTRREELIKGGGYSVPSLDEEKIRDEAYSKIDRQQQQSEEKKTEDRMYRAAFDARDTRDSLLPILPVIPIALAALFIAILWVARGFNKL
jgi:hypothetical protein